MQVVCFGVYRLVVADVNAQVARRRGGAKSPAASGASCNTRTVPTPSLQCDAAPSPKHHCSLRVNSFCFGTYSPVCHSCSL